MAILATVYKKWLKPENLIRIRGWKMQGLSDKQIAAKIGVSFSSVEHWKTRHPKIGKMLRVGKSIANYTIENALFQKAMRGNTACMIFWLKNNYHSKYSDSQDSSMDIKLKHAKIKRVNAQINDIRADAKIKQDRLPDDNGSDHKPLFIDSIVKFHRQHEKSLAAKNNKKSD